MRISLIAVLLIGLLIGLWAGVAHAQPATDKAGAQAAFAEGQRLYVAGEFLPAAIQFEAAYAIDPDPVYLFNIAQAYRLGNACPQAASYYNRFLAQIPNPPNLAKVEQYLEQSEACAAAAAAAATTTNQSGVIEQPVTERPATDDPGRTKRWLGIGSMFVGGAAIGVAVYYSTEAIRLTDLRIKIRSGCTIMSCDPAYGDKINEAGRQANLRSGLAYAVGGVAVIGGVVLFLLGHSAEGSSVAVVPISGGAYAVGAFTF